MYNCQKYIERCLQSLEEQTYTQLEILVVDDGSTDNCTAIVKDFQSKSDKVKYIYQKNSGPGVARNRAIEDAKGKYLLFVDADDYLDNDYIECLVKSAEENGSELAIAGYTWVYENSKKKKMVVPQGYVQYTFEEWVYRVSACWSHLYLAEYWRKNELSFNINKQARAEDVPIVLFANVTAKNITVVKNAGYYYYQHQGSAMNNKKKRVIFEFPYNAFEDMYRKVKRTTRENSEDYYFVGVLKFLAQFDLIIYRKADVKEKRRFREYLYCLINEDFLQMCQAWKRIKKDIRLPLSHKLAINIFIIRYKRNGKKYERDKILNNYSNI